jgi:hypothetical protein
MDILPLILSIIIILLLVVGMVYLVFFLPKKQEKLLERFDSLDSQQKETPSEKNNEETIKTTLELKEKIEQLSQELKTSKEVNKTLLENVDKSIKGEIVNQQKLTQEKSKELSEKINKDLEFRLNSNEKLIKTHLENLNKGIMTATLLLTN